MTICRDFFQLTQEVSRHLHIDHSSSSSALSMRPYLMRCPSGPRLPQADAALMSCSQACSACVRLVLPLHDCLALMGPCKLWSLSCGIAAARGWARHVTAGRWCEKALAER